MRVAIVTSSSWFTRKNVGGAEKQIYYISTVLADAGHSVDLYTMDIEEPQYTEGVNIIPAWNTKKGIKFFRFYTYRIPCLRKKIIQGEYDLVYLRGYSIFAPATISAARNSRAVSVIGLANDHNVLWSYWKNAHPKKSIIWHIIEWLKHTHYRKGALQKADIVGVQNEFQGKAVSSYNQKTVFIPNIFIPYEQDSSYFIEKETDIVWVGRFRFIKGIQQLSEIVARLPELSFSIVGKCMGMNESEILKNIVKHNNVKYYEYLSNNEVLKLIHSSKILLNTSLCEGFPNTFLEAWYARIPVISLNSDPNGLLRTGALGYCARGDIKVHIKGCTQ